MKQKLSSGTIQPTQQQRYIRYLLPLVLLSVIATALIYYGSPRSTAAGQNIPKRAFDPLSVVEHEQGIQQLNALQSSSQVEAAAAERQIVLSFERYHQPKSKSQSSSASESADRQGEGYIYNYETDTLMRVILSVDDANQPGAEPMVIETVQNVQLPLIQQEKEQALAILQSNEEAWRTISQQFEAITGASLRGVDQLNQKVIIFRADAMPDRVNAATSQCGLHRCAQVLLFTDDQIAFEVSPIIDLSTQTVTQLTWEEGD